MSIDWNLVMSVAVGFFLGGVTFLVLEMILTFAAMIVGAGAALVMEVYFRLQDFRRRQGEDLGARSWVAGS